jgi:transcriptional regulator with XRE-family HTH domain
MTDEDAEFAEAVRRRREAAGWTQAELAELTGLTTMPVHRIETMQRGVSRGEAVTIADVFGAYVEDMSGRPRMGLGRQAVGIRAASRRVVEMLRGLVDDLSGGTLPRVRHAAQAGADLSLLRGDLMMFIVAIEGAELSENQAGRFAKTIAEAVATIVHGELALAEARERLGSRLSDLEAAIGETATADLETAIRDAERVVGRHELIVYDETNLHELLGEAGGADDA